MDPKQGMMIGVALLAVFQVLAAVQVIRAANDRPDLEGASRLVPIVITLLIPVFGPFIGARATDAGMRPVFISVLGAAFAVGLYGLGTKSPKRPVGKIVASSGTIAKDGKDAKDEKGAAKDEKGAAKDEKGTAPQDAKSADSGKDGQEAAGAKDAKGGVGAEPTKAVAAKAPAPGDASTVAAAPAAIPGDKRAAAGSLAAGVPLTPAGATAGATPPAGSALLATPTAQPLPAAAPTAAATAVPLAALLLRPVLAEGQIMLPGPSGDGGYIEAALARSEVNNTRLIFGANLTAVGVASRAPQIFLGGRVYHFNDVADGFGPFPVAADQLEVGRVLQLPSLRGGYLAEVRVAEVTRDQDSRIKSGLLDVSVR